MRPQPRLRLRSAARWIAVGLIGLAACLLHTGCANIEIDASHLKIPGLTDTRREEPDARSTLKTFGEMEYRVEFSR